MIKHLLSAVLLAGISSTAFAQAPILTGTNINPSVNDSFVNVICETTGVLPGSSGASQTWNFSTSLLPSTTVYPLDTGYVVYAATTPSFSAMSLFSAAFATSSHAVITLPSGGAPGITTYYIGNAASLSSSGIYYDATTSAVYTDPMDLFRFPFTYASTFTDNYAGLVSFAGTTASEAGTVTTTADGWGVLTLPGIPSPVTYTGVLRVHSYQLFRDSANIFGTPVVQTDTIESYTWYKPGFHGALLTITTTKGPGLDRKVVSYAQRQIANHEAVPYVAGIESSLNLFPNPATSELNINFNTISNDQVRISLTDILGKEIAVISDKATQGAQHIRYNTSTLANGMYFVRLQTAGGSVTRRVEIQ